MISPEIDLSIHAQGLFGFVACATTLISGRIAEHAHHLLPNAVHVQLLFR
jgi:hypothetical protein